VSAFFIQIKIKYYEHN